MEEEQIIGAGGHPVESDEDKSLLEPFWVCLIDPLDITEEEQELLIKWLFNEIRFQWVMFNAMCPEHAEKCVSQC